MSATSDIDENTESIYTGTLSQTVELENVDSDTSELITSCVCGGRVLSRDCIMCDSADCQSNLRWYHARCVGISKAEFQMMSLRSD